MYMWVWKWNLLDRVQHFVIPWTVAHGILQIRMLEWVTFPFSRGSSQPRDQTQVSCIAGRFFTSWATEKPKNTGVGSLSLFQQIFPTQESNQGLLHCRQILYQLSYEGRPTLKSTHTVCKPVFFKMKINIWANILGKEDIYLALISLKIYFHLFNLAFILENKIVSTQSFLW